MGRAVANTDRYSGRESPPHPRRRPRCRGPHSGLALTALLVLFLSAGPKHAGTADSAPVQSDFLRRALAAGDYLLRAQRTDGSFVYMRRPVSGDTPPDKYNWLRHCGTAYALWQLFEETHAERFRDSAGRATQRLRNGPLQERTVEGRPFLVLVSDPAQTGSKPQDGPTVKTGGCALAAIVLLQAGKALQRDAYVDAAEKLGDYLLFVTDRRGAVRSKYLFATRAFSSWESEYYPGEAALALAMLEHVRPNPERRSALIRILLRLLGRWCNPEPSPEAALPGYFDHWAVLALVEGAGYLTDACLREHATDSSPVASLDALIGCAAVMADTELSRQVRDGSRDDGSFAPRQGLLCPTAIRLEGMLGLGELLQRRQNAMPGVGASRKSLAAVRPALLAGLEFLGRCQYTAADQERLATAYDITGGFRRSCGTRQHRDDEIRIDYCQHALSALLRADRLWRNEVDP